MKLTRKTLRYDGIELEAQFYVDRDDSTGETWAVLTAVFHNDVDISAIISEGVWEALEGDCAPKWPFPMRLSSTFL